MKVSKSERLEIRLTQAERAVIEHAASQSGKSMSAIIREILANLTNTSNQPPNLQNA